MNGNLTIPFSLYSAAACQPDSMMKRIAILGASAAALAAVAAPLATAQAPQDYSRDLAGAPQSLRGPGEDRGYDDRRADWRNDRYSRPDFQAAQAACSRAAIQEAWRTGAYSAQYNDAPRLVESRRGWEMVGDMRVHSRKGYTYGKTICELRRNGEVDEFIFRR